MWLGLSVSVGSDLTYGAPVRPENPVTYPQRATKVNIFVAICLKRLRSIMQRNMSKTKANSYAKYSSLPAVSFPRLTHSEAPEVTQ